MLYLKDFEHMNNINKDDATWVFKPELNVFTLTYKYKEQKGYVGTHSNKQIMKVCAVTQQMLEYFCLIDIGIDLRYRISWFCIKL